MYAFSLDRVTHLTLCRQNASLCGMRVHDGIETRFRQGPICRECSRIERETWVSEWHRKFGVLGPIAPSVDGDEDGAYAQTEKLVA